MTLLGSFIQENTNSSRNKRERPQEEREIYEETLHLLKDSENDEEMIRTTLQEINCYDSSFLETLMANTPQYPSNGSTKMRPFWRIGKKQIILWTQLVLQFSSTCYESPHQQVQQCITTTIHRHRARCVWICLILLYGFKQFVWHDNHSNDVYSTSTQKIKVTATDSLAMRTYHEDPMDTIATIQQYSSANQYLPSVQVSPTITSKDMNPLDPFRDSNDTPTILSIPFADTIIPIHDNSKYLRQQHHDPSLTINTAKLLTTTPSTKDTIPMVQQQRLPKTMIPTLQKSTIVDNPQKIVSSPLEETSPIGLPKPIGTFQHVKTLASDATIRQEQTPVHVTKHDIAPNDAVGQTTPFSKDSTLLSKQTQVGPEQPNKRQKGSNELQDNIVTETRIGFSNNTVTEQPRVEIWRPRKRGESKVPPTTLDDLRHSRFRPIPAGDLPKRNLRRI